ncbi:MAG: phosphonatase-like hydrolase [Bacteroidia bacterium]|nr:phosphonatase-like hydrolase [Bacteroidia bacterium]
MIELMIFDMAGTVVNEQNVVYRSMHKVLVEAGYTIDLDDILLQGAGKGKLQAFKDILKKLEAPDSDKLAKDIHQKFNEDLARAYDSLNVLPFESVEDVFSQLKAAGIKVVLNTGYDSATANKLLKKLNWTEGKTIDLLITNDQVSRGRPHPDMILLAMEKMGVQNPKTVGKIGDSIVDIEEGKAAECGMTLGITTGAQTKAQLQEARPDFILEQMSELPAVLGLA